MSHFIETLAQTISKNDRSNTKEIKLTQIPFQKIQPATTRLMETFTLITVIKIIDCDLRTLENFPNLPMLTDLYLAQNKLQGSLENLESLHQLKYIDLSFNLIGRSSRLAPLQTFRGVTACLANNPFTRRQQDWRNKVKCYGITIEDKSRNQNIQTKAISGPKISETNLDSIRPNSLNRQELQSYRTSMQSMSFGQLKTNSRIFREPPRRPFGEQTLEDLQSQISIGNQLNRTRLQAQPFQWICSREIEQQRNIFLQNEPNIYEWNQ